MSLERLPKPALLAKENGKRPIEPPTTKWTNYIEDLGWNRLGLHPREMMFVIKYGKVRQLNLELLSLQRSRKSGQ